VTVLRAFIAGQPG